MGKHFLKSEKDQTDFVEVKGEVKDFDIETYPACPPAPSEQYMNDTDDGF